MQVNVEKIIFLDKTIGEKIWIYSHSYSFVSWFGVIVGSLTSGLKSVANGVGNGLKDLGKKYLKFFQV